MKKLRLLRRKRAGENFGIPYARVTRIESGALYRECPKCGDEIEEIITGGSSLSNNYGRHYRERHQPKGSAD
jgi:hypothetical protein